MGSEPRAVDVAAPRTTIRMYHRVLPATPAAFGVPDCYRLRGTAVTPEELLAGLGGPVVALADVVRALHAGEAPPVGTVLTFDDGYAEWPAVAALLAGIPVTWCLCSAYRAEAAAPHPVDALYWLLDHAARPALALDVDGEPVRARLDDVASKTRVVTDSPLKRAVVAGRAELLPRVADALEVDLPVDLPRRLYPDAAGRRALARSGGIAAHGRTHRWLPSLDDAALARELDVAALAADLAVDVSGPPVLAWPDGAFDARTLAAARRVGFAAALTCEPGAIDRHTDPLRLPRVFARPGAA